MKHDTVRKMFIYVLLATVILSAIVFLLPIDPIIVGYSSINGVGSVHYEPKLKGIFMAIMAPVICYVYWLLKAFIHRNKDKTKRMIVNTGPTNILFFLLSPTGCIICIINIIHYIIQL